LSSATPQGWLEIELGELFSEPNHDIVDGPFGSNLKATEYVSSGIPIVRLQNIDRNKFISKNIQYVTPRKATELARHTFVPEDILITKLGDPLGKACIAPGGIEKGVIVADVVRARLTHAWVDNRFLCYQLNADQIVEQFKDQTKGTTRPRVNLTKIRSLKARLCPLPEQARIVEKLEELLSDLDAGVAELKAAQRKLAQYRQSLLKAAVEGVLTADWRADHGKPQEAGAELLQRILSVRRARWAQKQLAKFAEQGKTPLRDWQAKYTEPVAPDPTDLPPLPVGWVWASLGQLLESMTSGSRDWAPYYDRGVCTFVMAQNVRPWRPDFTFRQLVDPPPNDRDRARSRVEKDDLLITIVGANTGQCCRVPQELEEHFVCQSVALLRATEKSMSEFLNAVLNSNEHGQRQFREMNYGAGRPHLSFEQIESVLVPVPPVAEQEQILSVIAAGARQMEAIEVEIAKALRQTVAQRKNLLKAAFSGQLVPQDSNDEPASELLARIRAERANDGGAPRRRRKSA
jgi:type I restriction enzyme S subunit